MFEIAGGVILGIMGLVVLTATIACLAAIAIRYQSLQKANQKRESHLRRDQETTSGALAT